MLTIDNQHKNIQVTTYNWCKTIPKMRKKRKELQTNSIQYRKLVGSLDKKLKKFFVLFVKLMI